MCCYRKNVARCVCTSYGNYLTQQNRIDLDLEMAGVKEHYHCTIASCFSLTASSGTGVQSLKYSMQSWHKHSDCDITKSYYIQIANTNRDCLFLLIRPMCIFMKTLDIHKQIDGEKNA